MLTQNELKVLQAIDNSEYGDALNQDVWMFTIADNSDLKGKTISGTVSSLVQKGLVTTDDQEGCGRKNDFTIGMTAAGIAEYVAAMNGKTRKPADR